MITLATAVKEGRLDDFVRQQEALGIGPASEAALLPAASKVINTSQQSDQTSRSPSSGD
jgi:hypothetical protein